MPVVFRHNGAIEPPPLTPRGRMLTGIGRAIALVAFAGLLWTSYLWSWQANNLPRTPTAATGNIYQRNIHGLVVYQTVSQRKELETTQISSVSLFLVALSLTVLGKQQTHSAKGHSSAATSESPRPPMPSA